MQVEPEISDDSDEGYEPDELPPTLEYNNNVYDIYTDIDGLDEYIMIAAPDGQYYMVKTSAVKKLTHTF
jgi:hypothetical protein